MTVHVPNTFSCHWNTFVPVPPDTVAVNVAVPPIQSVGLFVLTLTVGSATTVTV